MTDRTGGRRDRRRARVECRENKHRYGSPTPVGAGIQRRVCLACGAVSIDLTGADDPVRPGLFGPREDATNRR